MYIIGRPKWQFFNPHNFVKKDHRFFSGFELVSFKVYMKSLQKWLPGLTKAPNHTLTNNWKFLILQFSTSKSDQKILWNLYDVFIYDYCMFYKRGCRVKFRVWALRAVNKPHKGFLLNFLKLFSQNKYLCCLFNRTESTSKNCWLETNSSSIFEGEFSANEVNNCIGIYLTTVNLKALIFPFVISWKFWQKIVQEHLIKFD